MKTDKILNYFKSLPAHEKREVLKSLENLLNPTEITRVIDGCPHCLNENLVKRGTFKTRTRYQCKSCKKTFTSLTGTSVSWLRKHQQWNRFLQLTLENESILYISNRLHLSTRTVFKWRHRVLGSLETIFTKKFKGIVESDDIHIPFNQKGRFKNAIPIGKKKRGDSNQKVKVFVMLDRYNTIDMKLARRGRIRAADIKRVVDMTRIDKNNLMVSDMHPSLIKFFKDTKLKYRAIRASKFVEDEIYHVQGLNSTAGSLKRWLRNNFTNVSTKYLQNYLWLYMIEKVLEDKDNSLTALKDYSMRDVNTYLKSKTPESRYQQFLKNSGK